MTYFLGQTPEFKSSQYWDGYDIYDEEQFNSWIPLNYQRLKSSQCSAPFAALFDAQDEIKQGNNVDVRYQTGTEFNPSSEHLEDGSVVVIDREILSRWVCEDPQVRWPERDHSSDLITPPISRPLSEYWLNTRYVPKHRNDPPNTAGEEMLIYQQEEIKYKRWLSWGVVVALEKDRRALQPFGFNSGSRERARELTTLAVIPLPVSIGEISLSSVGFRPHKHLSARGDSLDRIRGIDVVRLGHGKKERKTAAQRIGRFLPGLAHNA